MSSLAPRTGKSCTKCCEWKPLDGFYRRAASPDGLQHKCKQCDNADRKTHEIKRPDLAAARYARYRSSEKASRRGWYMRNRELVIRRAAQHKKSNPDRYRELARAYYRRNRDDFPARVAMRRARKKRASPTWANQDAIKSVYAEAIRRTKETGVKHHVDTIPRTTDIGRRCLNGRRRT